jgi:DNA polymerase I-like protein with 3'-5' exonuclease and polymerase domains
MTVSAPPGNNGTLPADARGAAAYYLRLGRLPVPVQDRGKKPWDHASGQPRDEWQSLRPSAADLDRLFPQGRASNIGLLLGAPSRGLLDVDLDCLQTVAAASALLPATGWVSGRQTMPRSHWWYQVVNPPDKASDSYRDIDGKKLVELRSSGGQTVVPPSVHESGEVVVWHTFDHPAQIDFVELIVAVRSVAAAALLARHWPDKGSRHDARLALSGALTRAGWSEERVTKLVRAVTIAACNRGIGDAEAVAESTADRVEDGKHVWGWPKLAELLAGDGKAVVRKVCEWLGIPKAAVVRNVVRPVRYRPLPPYTPFPLEALPPVLSDLTREAAAAIGCDPALVAVPAIATAAGCVGNSRAVLLKHGWIEPAIVWGLTVAPSGGHKSPAFHAATSPLMELQLDLFDAYRDRLEEYAEALKEWKDKDRDERGEAPEKPVEPLSFITSDTTIEALGELLRDNPRGLLVARDELDGWFQSFSRYKGKGGGSDRAQWLELHRAGTLRIDRITREKGRLLIRRACVPVCGTIQPAVLALALDLESLQAGLGARFLLAMPPPRRRVWNENELPEDLVTRYQNLLKALLDLPLKDELKRKPHVLGLAAPAKRAWVEFFNEWGVVQADAEGEQASAFAKIEAYASRLALIHHVVAHAAAGAADQGSITETSMLAGITLAKWFAAEAVRIYAMLAETHEERETRTLVEWIARHGGRTTVKEVQRSNNRRWTSSEQAEAALNDLVEIGLGRWEDGPRPAHGGKAMRWFVLSNTTHDDSDDRPGDGPPPPPPPHDDRSDDRPDMPRAEPGVSGTNPFVGKACGDTAPNLHSRSSESSCVVQTSTTAAQEGEAPAVVVQSPERSSCSVGSEPAWQYVKDASHFPAVLAALEESSLVGLDCETTGLNPRTDKVRLLSLAVDTIDGDRFVYVVDCFAVGPRPLFATLAEQEVLVHNGSFDLAMLRAQGFEPAAAVHDTMLLGRLLTAGIFPPLDNSLDALCQRHLQLQLDKTEQRSEWAAPELSEAQLRYAALDAWVLRPLFDALRKEIAGAGLERAAEIERRCLPGWVWMETAGMLLDVEAWKPLADEARSARAALRADLDALAPQDPDSLPGMSRWNWDSNQDVARVLELLGFQVEDTTDETLAVIDHPFAQKLREYRHARWLDSTYGHDFLRHVAEEDRRVYADWNQLGNVAGRSSCSGPNLQQIPRDGRYRRCFVAPPGRVIVKADFAAAHLRIAAKIANESKMIEAFRAGQDLHRLTARALLGKEEIGKQDRQLAKAVAFGLLYGMGAKGLRVYAKQSYGVDMTPEEAGRHKRTFFATYPGLATWHRRTASGKARQTETRTLTGRRRLLDKKTPLMHRLNSPVLGTEADAAKLALTLLWERRQQCPSARPVAFVHDEIVVEADAGQADAAAAWLRQAMLDAMAPLLDPVPVEVEVSVGRTWGGD